MKKVINLTEKDLKRIVKLILEQEDGIISNSQTNTILSPSGQLVRVPYDTKIQKTISQVKAVTTWSLPENGGQGNKFTDAWVPKTWADSFPQNRDSVHSFKTPDGKIYIANFINPTINKIAQLNISEAEKWKRLYAMTPNIESWIFNGYSTNEGEKYNPGTIEYKKEEDIKKYISTYYQCVPEGFRDAVNFAINTEKLNKTLVKYALGIIGRESSYGALIKVKDFSIVPTRYALKSPIEYIFNKMDDDNPIKEMIKWGATKFKGERGAKWVPSMGLAQMTPDIAKKYGVSVDDLMTAIGSLVSATRYLQDNYEDLTDYYDDNVPSFLIKDGKIVQNPYSTGNARLDAAIASYNVGSSKYRKKFCTTSDPKYAGPCNKTSYHPLPKSNKDFSVTVNQQDELKNYFPTYVDGKLTSTGYLNEVQKEAADFDCI